MAAEGNVRFIFDEAEWLATLQDPPAVETLLDIGEQVAKLGAARAQRRTGAGAASFGATEDDDHTVTVSWDDLHYYMYMQEFGTVHMPPHPALQLALEQYVM